MSNKHLLSKICYLWINGSYVALLKSYLSYRQQFMRFTVIVNTSGVPQRSNVGHSSYSLSMICVHYLSVTGYSLLMMI